MGRHRTLRRRHGSAMKRKKVMTPARKRRPLAAPQPVKNDDAAVGPDNVTTTATAQRKTHQSRVAAAISWFRRWMGCQRAKKSNGGESGEESGKATTNTQSTQNVQDSSKGTKACAASGSDKNASSCADSITSSPVSAATRDVSTGTEDAGDVLAYLVLKKLDFLAERDVELRNLVGMLQTDVRSISDKVSSVSSDVQTMRKQNIKEQTKLREDTVGMLKDTTGTLEDCIQREVLKATSRSRTMLRREQQVHNASTRKGRSSQSRLFASPTANKETAEPASSATVIQVRSTSSDDSVGPQIAALTQTIAAMQSSLQALQKDVREARMHAGTTAIAGPVRPPPKLAARSFAAIVHATPSLQKYSKMLKMRIPEQAVKNKMKMDRVSLPAESAAAPPPPGPPPAAARAATKPKTFAGHVHSDAKYAKYSRMLKMGIPEVAVKQKMTMDGINWQAAFNPASGTAGATATKKITADALKGVKLKSSKRRKLGKKKIDPKQPVVSGGQLQISEDMLKSVKLKSSRKPRKSSKAAKKLKAAATAVGLCVGPGGFGMTLDALKSVKLRKSKKKAVSPSKRKKPERSSPKVLFQLKKTAKTVPRSPGGTPLLSKKKRRMSILGKTLKDSNQAGCSSPSQL